MFKQLCPGRPIHDPGHLNTDVKILSSIAWTILLMASVDVLVVVDHFLELQCGEHFVYIA